MTRRTKRTIRNIVLFLGFVTAMIGFYLLTAVFGPNEEINLLPALISLPCFGFTLFVAKAAYGG